MYASICLKPSFKLSNRKLVFFNHTKDIDCRECGTDLIDELIVSRPKGKYICVKCALRIHIIEQDVLNEIDKQQGDKIGL
ncbi:MAG: hypothetical protein CMI54_08075 [Parcubacteria group bacterium]|jgi:ribosomal protein S27E|nr:hypothetical protein [Parcubacteria group bacterium]